MADVPRRDNDPLEQAIRDFGAALDRAASLAEPEPSPTRLLGSFLMTDHAGYSATPETRLPVRDQVPAPRGLRGHGTSGQGTH